MKPKHIFVTILASWLFFNPEAGSFLAVQRMGWLRGSVADQRGNPVEGAHILAQSIRNPHRRLNTAADRQGRWRLLGLTSGRWRITVSHPLHISDCQTLQVRQLGRNRTVKFCLKRFVDGCPLDGKLDRLLLQYMRRYQPPGMAVGIVRRQKLIYSRGIGVRSVTDRAPVTPDTLFNMASVSKLFVAAAVMKLVEAGRLNLDKPVIKYLPYFKLAGKGYHKITLRHILSHQSGLPPGPTRLPRIQAESGGLRKYVRNLRTESLMASPGKEWHYSNTGFNILGEVIARVSGMTFEDYIKENILDPLGMYRSTFRQEFAAAGMVSSAHVKMGPEKIGIVRLPRCSGTPSCGLYSSIRDMARWAAAVLNRERFRERRIMKPSSFDRLTEPLRVTGLGGTEALIGLSWFLGHYRGHRIMGHSGHVAGFKSHFLILPDDSIALIILINADYPPLSQITTPLLNTLLALDPQST